MKTKGFFFFVGCFLLSLPVLAGPGDFVGRWALDVTGGGASWLEVTQEAGYFDGSLLWIGGSVLPLASVYFDGDTLCATRNRTVERKDAAGNVVRTQEFSEFYTATVSGDTIKGTRVAGRPDGLGVERAEFTGKRVPPPGAKPDLGKVKFGKAVELFNGKNLDGWRLTDEKAVCGWRAEGGVLVNEPKQEEGKPHIHYGNLRTEGEFEDFNLTCEVRVPENGNSGIYLRGIYEVQVLDSFGKPLDSHNMCGIYSRLTPAVSAEKPAGEWQTVDITLVDRHVTVKLNGQVVQDNVALPGCTGGALWSDEFRPGPIYLQGDHTGVSYRNMQLRPVLK